MIIDTHCHLTAPEFNKDRSEVIERALAKGVQQMLCIADGLQSSKDALLLAKKYEQIFCTIGIHPHKADEWSPVVQQEFLELTTSNTLVKAVGEIGLDYHYDFCDRQVQKIALTEQIDLAKQVNLPVVLHNRDSWADFWSIITATAPKKAVLHCCTEPWANVEQWVQSGYMLSFTGIATFKNAVDIHNTIIQCPLSSIMVETDSPYLAPVPHRGKRNEPAYVQLVAERIAELKEVSVAEVIEQTGQNAVEFFDLPKN